MCTLVSLLELGMRFWGKDHIFADGPSVDHNKRNRLQEGKALRMWLKVLSIATKGIRGKREETLSKSSQQHTTTKSLLAQKVRVKVRKVAAVLQASHLVFDDSQNSYIFWPTFL